MRSLSRSETLWCCSEFPCHERLSHVLIDYQAANNPPGALLSYAQDWLWMWSSKSCRLKYFLSANAVLLKFATFFCPFNELYLTVQQSQVYKELTTLPALLEALLSCIWTLLPTCGM